MGNPIFATVITGLGFVCLAFAVTTVFLPYWGHFEEANRGSGTDRGTFSPWRVCKELTYDREKCGAFGNFSRFKPSYFVLASGIMNAIAAVALAIYCMLQLFGITSKKAFAVKSKLGLAIVAALATFACAGMFAIQTDDFRRGFTVTKGVSFYLVIVSIVLTIALCIMSLIEIRSQDKEYQRGNIQLKQTRC